MDALEKIRNQYSQRGIGGRLCFGQKAAVLVVDLINGFTDPTFPAGSSMDAVVESTRQLLDVARSLSVPVVFTTIVFGANGFDSNVWLRKMPALSGLQRQTRWVEIDDRLSPGRSEPVIEKQAASAFTGTSLITTLTSLRVDTLVVCGATTSGCVRATVVDACMLGFSTFVPRECVGDRASIPHDVSLLDIDSKYGDVITLSSCSELLLQAGARSKSEIGVEKMYLDSCNLGT